MARKKDQRKKSVVNPRVQWTLAGRVLLHFFVFICGGALIGLISQVLSNPLVSLPVQLSTYWQHQWPMLMALLCLLPIFVRDTLTLSNRMAGPICRLRDTIQRIADGEETPPLRFRSKDMWGEMPELFNRMIDRLKQAPNAAAAPGSESPETLECPTPSRTVQPELQEV